MSQSPLPTLATPFVRPRPCLLSPPPSPLYLQQLMLFVQEGARKEDDWRSNDDTLTLSAERSSNMIASRMFQVVELIVQREEETWLHTALEGEIGLVWDTGENSSPIFTTME